jgi:hypothetical protein
MRALILIAATASLGSGTAERALVRKLERYQSFRSAHATCSRHTAREQRCTWRGRRPDGEWRGRAVVRRLKGGAIDVRITSAGRV